jgi:hypothetical protein
VRTAAGASAIWPRAEREHRLHTGSSAAERCQYTNDNLVAYFPRQDLDLHLRVLRTERPVWVLWRFAADSNHLSEFELIVGDQFPGQGVVGLPQ